MKVTLLKAEKSFLSIKINTPDVSTNVKELKIVTLAQDSLGLEVFRTTQF